MTKEQKDEADTKYTRRENKYPIPFSDSKYPLISSLFFLVPCIYGFRHKAPYHATVSLLTAAFSLNYWRRADLGKKT